jgi:hypothetical protein
VLWKIWISFSRGIDIYGQSNKLELLQNLQVVKRMLSSHISQIKMDIDKRIYSIENAIVRAEYSESKVNK